MELELNVSELKSHEEALLMKSTPIDVTSISYAFALKAIRLGNCFVS